MKNEILTTIDEAVIKTWLAINIKHMEDATVNAPACWYDGSDGTCSA